MPWTTIEEINRQKVEGFAEFGIYAESRELGAIILTAKGTAKVLRLLREGRKAAVKQSANEKGELLTDCIAG